MRAYIRPVLAIALAFAATVSLGQTNLSPIDNGFFRPAADPALTPPRPRDDAEQLQFAAPQPVAVVTAVPAPGLASIPAASAVEVARPADQQQREVQQRREEQQMLELERQNELNRSNSNRPR